MYASHSTMYKTNHIQIIYNTNVTKGQCLLSNYNMVRFFPYINTEQNYDCLLLADIPCYFRLSILFTRKVVYESQLK